VGLNGFATGDRPHQALRAVFGSRLIELFSGSVENGSTFRHPLFRVCADRR